MNLSETISIDQISQLYHELYQGRELLKLRDCSINDFQLLVEKHLQFQLNIIQQKERILSNPALAPMFPSIIVFLKKWKKDLLEIINDFTFFNIVKMVSEAYRTALHLTNACSISYDIDVIEDGSYVARIVFSDSHNIVTKISSTEFDNFVLFLLGNSNNILFRTLNEFSELNN